jgi:hypothetical protein
MFRSSTAFWPEQEVVGRVIMQSFYAPRFVAVL